MTKKIVQMNKGELLDVANTFFVEIPEGASVKEIRAAIAQENITDEEVANADIIPVPAPDAPVVTTVDEGALTTSALVAKREDKIAPLTVDPEGIQANQENVLLRYERQNPTYQVLQYSFSHSHPFQVVKAEDADYIVKNVPGFRPALQSEVKDFYA